MTVADARVVPPLAGAGPERRSARAAWRLRQFVVCVLLTGLAFNSQSGRLSPDTKLDLLVNPGAFLHRALRLWDPQGSAGQLQNQAYGYLFPMGPFFWLGHLAGLPPWIVQRLWWSALMCAAFLGVVTLAQLLSIGNGWTRLLAGVGYATSPHILTLLGANSVESLPMCVAPWVVVPLVVGSRGGSARRAGMLCGIAVLFMGGVNAAAVFAGVLPALLWLITRRPSRQLLQLTGWSALGVLLACFWWLVPLLLLGKYSPPFLDYIETSATTTQTTSLVEVLRGTADWVPYLISSGWHAGWLLLTEPALIANTVLVAIIGMTGIALRRMPNRLWLVSCLAVGLVAVTFGHRAGVGSAFADQARVLLDGPLAPLRNVHKFDLLIRLPLALGLAEMLSRLRWGRTLPERRLSQGLVAAVAAIAVVGAATPLFALKLATDSTFAAIPNYWSQAAGWLAKRDATGRALLVPGSGIGDYYWGKTADEPLQPLAGASWEVRNNVPLVPPGHTRALDAIEQQLSSGTGSTALAAFLARSGIDYLVVRNDLNYSTTQSIPPAVVHASLENSPGLARVASFGPPVGSLGSLSTAVDQYLQQSYPAVEIWQASDSTGADSRASVVSQDQLNQVSGGPESVFALQQQAILGYQPTVLTGQNEAAPQPSSVILTDGLRRREVNFGGPANDSSATLTASDSGTLNRKQLDYLPVSGAQHQTVAELLGADSITASSSAADASSFLPTDRSAQPYSAFDGDAETAWLSRPGANPVGQWLQIDFTDSLQLQNISIRFADRGTRPREIRLTTQSGSVDTAVGFGVDQTFQVAPGATRYLRVSVLAVDPRNPLGQVGLADVAIPGVQVSRTLRLPDDAPAGRAVDALAFQASPDARPSCLLLSDEPLCVAGFGRLGEDAAGLDRTFSLPVAAQYQLSASAVPRPGPALTRLIASTVQPTVTLSSSSQSVPDPLAGASSAFDADPQTGWIASAQDPDPTLTLTWKTARTIASFSVSTLFSLPATRPDRVRIVSPAGQRSARIDASGRVTFTPLRTNSLTLHFANGAGLRANFDTTAQGTARLGIGISELRIPGLTAPSRSATDAKPVTLPCGLGPSIAIDGRLFSTQLRTTVGALRDLRPATTRVCGDTAITLRSGGHRLVMPSSLTWSAAGAVLQRDAAVSAPGPVASRVVRWDATQRSVAVAERAAPAVLIVRENSSAGWQARAGGRSLQPIVLDGWQQGFLLPAGAATTVQLSFGPQRSYAVGLVVGLLCVLALLLLACLPGRNGSRSAVPGYRRPDAAVVVLGLVCCGAIGGWPGLLTWLGSMAALVSISSAIGHRLTRIVAAPALAAASFGLAGVLLVRGHWGQLQYAGNDGFVQVLCLVAVAAVISGAAVVQRSNGRRPVRQRSRASVEPGAAGLVETAGSQAPSSDTAARAAQRHGSRP